MTGLVGLLLVGAASAGVVAEGHEAFERGDVDAAIAAWSRAREGGGHPSGVVEYDLGTALLRRDDPVRALPRFLAAARLRPRDANVQHDLALTRSLLQERSQGRVLPEPASPIPGFGRVLAPGELGVVGLLVTALGSAALLLRRRLGPAVGAALLALGLALGAVGAWGLERQARHPLAGVVDAAAVMRDAPDVGAGERQRLPAGTEVRVERRYGSFLLVEDGRGRRGWLADNVVELAWTL